MKPPKLRPGATAYSWVTFSMLMLPLCVIGLGALPYSAWFHVIDQVFAMLAITGLLGAVGLLAATTGLKSAIQREEAAGYTTLFDAYKPELWQLDHKTGAVVRHPSRAHASRSARR